MFQLKMDSKTKKEELILTKKTKIEDPNKDEMDFDLKETDEETVEAIDSSIEEIQERGNNSLVDISGSVSFISTAETVNVRGKTLTKQEALFIVSSRSLRLVGTGHTENEIRPMLQHIKRCHEGIQWG